MPDQEPDLRGEFRWVELSQVGLEMVSPIVIGLVLDNWLGWAPWLTIVGALLGFGVGMVRLIRVLGNRGKRDGNGVNQRDREAK
jgi:F0F1-type ATP synthase assembly protein I